MFSLYKMYVSRVLVKLNDAIDKFMKQAAMMKNNKKDFK